MFPSSSRQATPGYARRLGRLLYIGKYMRGASVIRLKGWPAEQTVDPYTKETKTEREKDCATTNGFQPAGRSEHHGLDTGFFEKKRDAMGLSRAVVQLSELDPHEYIRITAIYVHHETGPLSRA